MRDLHHPDVADLDLPTVLHALSDPTRLQIVAATSGPEAAEGIACGSIAVPVSPATASHHLRVLREAGITHTRVVGRMKYISLRREDLDARFPGLLDSVLASIAARQRPPVAA